MKKLAVLVAVVSIAALAAPALSATNPFMDVPMNHWAYDAIGQLAAHGILSGYPDGLYKGKQQTTRYEMASALARALAVVDMTKASKQDVEMLKRLVVEFKDELEALGVRVDELDERVAVLEERLGGWHIHGVLALDFNYKKANEPGDDADASFTYDDAKLFFERTWGEDDEYFFQARTNVLGQGAENVTFDRFFVEMPFFFDSRLTVGRFVWNLEGDYKLGLPGTGTWDGDSGIATNWEWDGFGLKKNFAIGSLSAVVAHPGNGDARRGIANRNNLSVFRDANGNIVNTWSGYLFMLGFDAQFTEQIGLNLGGEVVIGDNAEDDITYVNNQVQAGNNPLAFDKFWEVWAGLRFNFNDNIAFKGIFYHQAMDTDAATAAGWRSNGYGIIDNNGNVVDDANHWALMFDVKQEALKYTSLWLEYGQYDQGFITRTDRQIAYGPMLGDVIGVQAPVDLKYWRVALGQEWNDKWATHIFYYGYKYDVNNGPKPSEIGVGVQYKLNDYTTMGLNYIHTDMDVDGVDNDDSVRFRTSISF